MVGTAGISRNSWIFRSLFESEINKSDVRLVGIHGELLWFSVTFSILKNCTGSEHLGNGWFHIWPKDAHKWRFLLAPPFWEFREVIEKMIGELENLELKQCNTKLWVMWPYLVIILIRWNTFLISFSFLRTMSASSISIYLFQIHEIKNKDPKWKIKE